MLNKSLIILAIGAIALLAGDKINGAGATFPAPVYYAWFKGYVALPKETKDLVRKYWKENKLQ